MEEHEIDALKKLLGTNLLKTVTQELAVLHKYRHVLRDDQLHAKWTNSTRRIKTFLVPGIGSIQF